MKKRNIMKTLFAGTMTLGMALSITPAFAVDKPEEPVKAYLVKQLDIAEGITYNKTFTFCFDLQKIGSETVETGVGDVEIDIPVDQTNNIVAKNIFDEGCLTYDAAGIYTYKVTEPHDSATDEAKEGEYGLTYSDAQYELQVYVANDKENPGEVFVEKVLLNKDKNDNGTSESTGKIEDINPEKPIDSKFRFINKYTAQAGGTTDEHGTVGLAISKTVTGDYGDKTKDFNFTVDLEKAPTSADNTEGFMAKIYNKDTMQFESIENLNYGVNNIVLAHNEELRIYDLPAGTNYEITENEYADYTPSISVTQNGEELSEISNSSTDQKYVGVNENKVEYTNTFITTSVTPTGIFINNLPFVLMVVVAGSGLALYVVSKRRSHQ